jgi:succinoglycan biosynthesis transport protein ExoP
MSLAPFRELPQQPPAAGRATPPRDYGDVLRRRKVTFVLTFLLVMAAGVALLSRMKPVYAATTRLLMPSPPAGGAGGNSPLAEGIPGEGPATQVQVILSPEFQQRAFARANIQARPNVDPPTPRAEVLPSTNVIRVIVEGGDPFQVTDLANAIAEQHVEDMLAQTSGPISGTLQFVRDRKEQAEKKLAAAEQALLRFKQQQNVALRANEQTAQSKEFVDLSSEVSQAQSELAGLRAQLSTLQAQLAGETELLVQESFKENPKIPKLEDQLDKVQQQKIIDAPNYQPTSRHMKLLDEQEEKLKQQLETEPKEVKVQNRIPNPARPPIQAKIKDAQTALRSAEARYQAALTRLNTLKSGPQDGEAWQIQQERLNREKAAAESAVQAFSEDLRRLEIQAKTGNQAEKIIEQARVPSGPVRPERERFLLFTALIGLFLATGMALLRDRMDDRVHSAEEVDRMTGLPTLGYLPKAAVDMPALVEGKPLDPRVNEAYDTLQASVAFASFDTPLQRLLITSPAEGDGKSITALNLALAMALDGKWVILVDADMRRPSVHRLLNVPGVPGLSDVLVGRRSLEQVLHCTHQERLRVLCAGTIPPNPGELLNSLSFERVLQELDARADVVIFDTPGCTEATDALIAATRMDGVVLVVNSGRTRKAAVQQAEELLARARARVLGVVFSGAHGGRNGATPGHYYHGGYYADLAQQGDERRRGGPRPELGTGVSPPGALREEDRL